MLFRPVCLRPSTTVVLHIHRIIRTSNNGKEEARAMVHATREAAAELGGKALAAVALELEMAIKAGADTTVALHRFDSITTDTLVAMATVAAQ